MVLGRAVRRVMAATLLGILGVGVWASGPAAAGDDRVRVAAAFYPLVFAAERIGGRRVSVTNLTPQGAEPHDLELTSKQRDEIEDADLVVVMGADFQPSVERAARDRDGPTLEILRRRAADEDPHVWLDPSRMRAIASEVADALTEVDPAGRTRYARNAQRLDADLEALDTRLRAGLAHCERHLLITAHDSFGRLAAAYGLDHEGASGRSPDSEPDPRRIAALADLAARERLTTIFTENLVSPAVARTIAREAGGLKTVVLNPLEGLTAREIDAGDDYLSVMDRNLTRIRTALGCRDAAA